MFAVDPLTQSIGAQVNGVDFAKPLSMAVYDAIYQALIDHQVIFIRGANIGPQAHLDFAQSFGELDQPHPSYPHVPGFDNMVLLENDAANPPDTNCWHTDLTYKAEQPFASILVAREVPRVGGDTLWSSCIAAYDRLSEGMKHDLMNLIAVHDLGDFRNNFFISNNAQASREQLNEAVARYGHNVHPLISEHPVSGRKYLNFNESFVTHIFGMTTNESMALKTFLANHMNKPEDQVRWRWQHGDLAMWDNRVTMHYAVADYLPRHRCMNRITIVHDRRLEQRSISSKITVHQSK